MGELKIQYPKEFSKDKRNFQRKFHGFFVDFLLYLVFYGSKDGLKREIQYKYAVIGHNEESKGREKECKIHKNSSLLG